MDQLKLFIGILLVASCASKKPINGKQTKASSDKTKTIEILASQNKNPEPPQVQSVKESLPIPTKPKNKLSATTVSIHHIWDKLLQKHVSQTGAVDYLGMSKEKQQFLDYFELLHQQFPKANWSKEKRMAYWINVYNVYTVWLILKNWPVSSIKEIKNPWKQRFFRLGSKWYNLNEVEHQILRKMEDPRIHFGINCASISCPKLHTRAFTEENLSATLDKLTKAFVQDPEKNNIQSKHIKLSKIFSWFAKDFKKQGSLIDFLNQYSDIVIEKQAKKQFLKYNWQLND